ncbi:hypothetical protein CDAR_483121 [Caerostris darwini]|uniref:Uncharacterized protein n=1 Tax=Caerostris darwini TaxID=1538125 RepID=A0AAV4V4S5_9ARAC|nr:hypothetical protein CDAR_483121 [Caerostris darwini]
MDEVGQKGCGGGLDDAIQSKATVRLPTYMHRWASLLTLPESPFLHFPIRSNTSTPFPTFPSKTNKSFGILSKVNGCWVLVVELIFLFTKQGSKNKIEWFKVFKMNELTDNTIYFSCKGVNGNLDFKHL